MAAIQTAVRSSELTSHDLQDHPQARSPPHANDMNSTPSVSPLSNVSKSINDNSAPRKPDIHQTRNGTAPQDEEDGMDSGDRDDRSSSLSDFDGSFDEQDRPVIDEQLLAPADEGNESEASTERLENSPRKVWRNRGLLATTERTPSKLNRQTSYADDLSEVEDAESVQRDGSASPTRQRGHQTHSRELVGRKRKRSTPLSDRGSSLSAESDAENATEAKPDSRLLDNREDPEPDANQEEVSARARLPSATDAKRSAMESDEEPDIANIRSPTKSGKRKRGAFTGRNKGQSNREEIKTEDIGHTAEDPEEVQEDDEEDSADTVSAEELEKREQASHAFSAISRQFAVLRNKFHADRLASAEAELTQLHQSNPTCTHPEYLAMVHCVTARRDKKITQEMNLRHYKKQSLRQQTVATRSQLLSQYFQEARDIREDILESLGKQWYDIQKERRSSQADELDKYMYKFPKKRKSQIKRQARYNLEVSVLSGMAKHVGFPAAPDIEGARTKEADADMKAMRIASKQPQTFPYALSEYQPRMQAPSAPTSEHLAQKEFLEQTPWANPQHPVHYQSRTPSAFGFGFGDPSSRPGLADMLRQSSMSGRRPSSPFSTPMLGDQRRAEKEANVPGSNETIGMISDPPSSVQAAPPTADRIQLLPRDRMGDVSPTAQLKRAAGTRRADSKRDFSGVSNASTIDAPAEGSSGMDHPSIPGLPMDASAVNQAFSTSALHAQHDDDRKPDVYRTADFRLRMGSYGTPMPLGSSRMTLQQTAGGDSTGNDGG